MREGRDTVSVNMRACANGQLDEAKKNTIKINFLYFAVYDAGIIVPANAIDTCLFCIFFFP